METLLRALRWVALRLRAPLRAAVLMVALLFALSAIVHIGITLFSGFGSLGVLASACFLAGMVLAMARHGGLLSR